MTDFGNLVLVYRVDGSTKGAKTNYQAEITVNYEEGYMREDFGDIRFTLFDETELRYDYLEKVDGDHCLFVVEIPEIPEAPGDVSVYVRAGNPELEMDNTHDIWDIHEDFDVDMKVLHGINSQMNYDTVNSKNVLVNISASGGSPGYVYNDIDSFVGEWEIKARMTGSWNTYLNYYFLGGTDENDVINGQPKNSYLITYNATSHKIELRVVANPNTYDANGGTVLITSGTISDPTIYHVVKVTRDVNGHFELFVDGTSVGTATDTTYTSFAMELVGSWSPWVYGAPIYVEYIKKDGEYVFSDENNAYFGDYKWIDSHGSLATRSIADGKIQLEFGNLSGFKTLKQMHKCQQVLFKGKVTNTGWPQGNVYIGFQDSQATHFVRQQWSKYFPNYFQTGNGAGVTEQTDDLSLTGFPSYNTFAYDIRYADDARCSINGGEDYVIDMDVDDTVNTMNLWIYGGGTGGYTIPIELEYLYSKQYDPECVVTQQLDWESAITGIYYLDLPKNLDVVGFCPRPNKGVGGNYQVDLFPMDSWIGNGHPSRIWIETVAQYLLLFEIVKDLRSRYKLDFVIEPLKSRYQLDFVVNKWKYDRYKLSFKIDVPTGEILQHNRSRYKLDFEIEEIVKKRYLLNFVVNDEIRRIKISGVLRPRPTPMYGNEDFDLILGE